MCLFQFCLPIRVYFKSVKKLDPRFAEICWEDSNRNCSLAYHATFHIIVFLDFEHHHLPKSYQSIRSGYFSMPNQLSKTLQQERFRSAVMGHFNGTGYYTPIGVIKTALNAIYIAWNWIIWRSIPLTCFQNISENFYLGNFEIVWYIFKNDIDSKVHGKILIILY